jgi:16S rRNA (adenine1518-N6/adenine1519-N6)-dimethyltransferase
LTPLIRAKKSLGQNFLTDERIARRIVDAVSPLPTDIVIEIGPGTGALTRLLVERSGWVEAIEIDSHLADELRRSLKADNLSIVTADALSLDWGVLISDAQSKLNSIQLHLNERKPTRVRIVANLPYYISTPIIEKLLSLDGRLFDMTLMLQKEVARRITSGPGGKQYGSLSVMVQYYCIASELFEVPSSAFTPPPKVKSAVIKLAVRAHPPVEVADEQLFFRLVRSTFAQRRKTILNNLKASEKALRLTPDLEAALEAASVATQRRAETLSLAEFAALYRALGPE